MLPTVILLSYFGAGLDTLERVGDFPSRCVVLVCVCIVPMIPSI